MELTRSTKPIEIRRYLEYGDNNKIAEKTGYHAVYVSRVMGGNVGVNPENIKIIDAALELINTRKKEEVKHDV